jgi:phosphopantetheinyl transferase (holo-ACP synthase)
MQKHVVNLSTGSGEVVTLNSAEETQRANEIAAWEAGAAARAAEEVQMNRRAAYQEEADGLYFKEQRGEVAAGTWAAKVAEIKARYPK